MKKNLSETIAVIAITIAATMMTYAGITTITQQANAEVSNTGSNTGSCTMSGTASGSGTTCLWHILHYLQKEP
jgi:hypothetical protein